MFPSKTPSQSIPSLSVFFISFSNLLKIYLKNLMYISIQAFAIELRGIFVALTILKIILQFNWSKFSWLDVIWKGAHCCLYKVPQLTVNFGAKMQHEAKGTSRRDCLRHKSGEGYGTISSAWRYRWWYTHGGLHHLYVGQVWNHQDSSHLNWAIGKKGFSQRGKQEPNVHSFRTLEFSSVERADPSRSTTVSTGLYGWIARQKPLVR